jgi:hypothetical protein
MIQADQTASAPAAPADANPSDIVHLAGTCCLIVQRYALCGALIRGELAHGEPPDCVVCVELDRRAWRCPECGTWM